MKSSKIDLSWSWFYFSSAAGVPVAGIGSRQLVLLILAITIVMWKFKETPCPSCRLNSTFTVSEKPPFPHLGIVPCRCPKEDHLPRHMQMNRCHKIPVTRLKCYCHPGCDRLFKNSSGHHNPWLGFQHVAVEFFRISSALVLDFI